MLRIAIDGTRKVNIFWVIPKEVIFTKNVRVWLWKQLNREGRTLGRKIHYAVKKIGILSLF